MSIEDLDDLGASLQVSPHPTPITLYLSFPHQQGTSVLLPPGLRHLLPPPCRTQSWSLHAAAPPPCVLIFPVSPRRRQRLQLPPPLAPPLAPPCPPPRCCLRQHYRLLPGWSASALPRRVILPCCDRQDYAVCRHLRVARSRAYATRHYVSPAVCTPALSSALGAGCARRRSTPPPLLPPPLPSLLWNDPFFPRSLRQLPSPRFSSKFGRYSHANWAQRQRAGPLLEAIIHFLLLGCLPPFVSGRVL